ncbi:MAG: hypothetical protein H6Q15_2432 [Bacteroidetes bacterium]|nr:hypothetical protein [Bacteroidota bacterium]
MKRQKNDIIAIINSLVLNGKLPIPFFNSQEVNNDVEHKNIQNNNIENKYKQKKLPEAEASLLISKIYEIL